ncbi:MAG: DUF6504 family protein [Micromonosporaceae bacterium]
MEVWTHDDGRPARFVWRGWLLYTVMAVLDHTVISRESWRRRGPDPGQPADREFWRVRASPGQEPPRGMAQESDRRSGGAAR